MSPSAVEVIPDPDPLPTKNGASDDAKPKYRAGDPALMKLPIVMPTFEDKYEERKFLKHRLALAFRIFAKHGFMESVAGHITVRDPVEPDTFWVNPFGTLAGKSS